MLATARCVDAIRRWLPKQNRRQGLVRVISGVGFDDLEVRAALRYLTDEGEIIHYAHDGYEYVTMPEARAALKAARTEKRLQREQRARDFEAGLHELAEPTTIGANHHE